MIEWRKTTSTLWFRMVQTSMITGMTQTLNIDDEVRFLQIRIIPIPKISDEVRFLQSRIIPMPKIGEKVRILPIRTTRMAKIGDEARFLQIPIIRTPIIADEARIPRAKQTKPEKTVQSL